MRLHRFVDEKEGISPVQSVCRRERGEPTLWRSPLDFGIRTYVAVIVVSFVFAVISNPNSESCAVDASREALSK